MTIMDIILMVIDEMGMMTMVMINMAIATVGFNREGKYLSLEERRKITRRQKANQC